MIDPTGRSTDEVADAILSGDTLDSEVKDAVNRISDFGGVA